MNELEQVTLPEDGAEMLHLDLEELQDLTRCPICWGELGCVHRVCATLQVVLGSEGGSLYWCVYECCSAFLMTMRHSVAWLRYAL